MEDENKNFENLVTHAEDYLKTRQELTQHILTEKAVVMSSSLTSSIILLLLFVIAILFLSVALALVVSSWFDSDYMGFVIVGGFYFVLAVLFAMMKEKWIERPVMNRMIKKIYKED